VLGQHCFDNQFVFPVEALTKNLDILKYRMQICRYKLENNTLNSVLDSDYEKDMLKGTEVLFGEKVLMPW
jgi:hypothetical protein